MKTSTNHQPPEVTTEPQRQALDDMSRQLVERLNEMVREQNERAERFAATQHSLSPLPGQPTETPEPPAVPPFQPQALVIEEPDTAPEPALPPVEQPRKKKKIAIPQLFPSTPKNPQTFDNKPLWEGTRPKWPNKNSTSDAGKAEESGCGTFPTIVAIIIIVIILRACS